MEFTGFLGFGAIPLRPILGLSLTVPMNQLTAGEVPSVDALGEKEGRYPADVSRILQLSFLAPDIIEAILNGRQPIELNSQMLTRLGTLPPDWLAQRRLLGFLV